MPCFTGNIQNNQILFSCSVVKPIASPKDKIEIEKLPNFKALLDTGAQHTCIRQSVVDAVGLVPSGWGAMHGVGGQVQCPKYMVNIFISVLESSGLPDKDGTVTQTVIGKGFNNTYVSFLEGDHFDFDVLLGMDIIQKCNLQIHTGNLFTLCI